MVGQGRELVEGGRGVSHEEVLNLLGETALVGAPQRGVVPPTISGQGAELQGVVCHTPGSLTQGMQVPRRVGPL